MKKRIWDAERKDLTLALFIVLAALLAAGRLFMAAMGRLYLTPEGAPIDDMLMYNAAVSIAKGEWLGAYSCMTMAKHMFFSVWLAFVNRVGAPYLVANAALYLVGCLTMAAALRPVVKKRVWMLAVFAVLAFSPVSFDEYIYRVYRDSITLALLLLAFGGLIGAVLRCGEKGSARWVFAVLGGLGLGASWLNREDGIWLLPFAVCFVLVGVVGLARTGRLCRASNWVSLCLPFAVMAACLAAYAGMNQHFYGRFILSDLTSRDFTRAYGALVGIEDEDWKPREPISGKTRQTLYDNSEFFASLEPYWESRTLKSGYGSRAQDGEYGGSFYFAWRIANDWAGYYPDAVTAKAFYEKTYDELQRLADEGVIEITHRSASTVPFWRNEYLAPLTKELGSSLYTTLFFPNYTVWPQFSDYTKQYMVDEICAFVNGRIEIGYAAGTDQPYYNPGQKLAFSLEDMLGWVYRVLSVPALLAGLWCLGAYAPAACRLAFRRRHLAGDERAWSIWMLLLGLLLCVILRCGIIAYMEVTAFAIGTYLMYLSTAAILLELFAVLGIFCFIENRKERKEKRKC